MGPRSASSYFQIPHITSLKNIPPNSKIYIIGVCGVAMAQLAVLLAEKGFEVWGSDKEFYEPMVSVLKQSRVKVLEGYRKEQIPKDAALIVIGNAVSYTNEEVQAVEENRLPYSIFPSLLYELIIEGNHSVVISGTHGKTTTTALLTFILEELRKNPSYFVGGVSKNLQKSIVSSSGKISVVEGDEYDSAFFAKIPKFRFYKPDTLVITSIEFDHADIYRDLHSVEKEFEFLVNSLHREANIVVCVDDQSVRVHANRWKAKMGDRVISYGFHKSSDYNILEALPTVEGQKIKIKKMEEVFDINLSLMGTHNACNALSTYIVAELLGLPSREVLKAFPKFYGVKRRQEILYNGRVTLIEDFAHHPTAVRETVRAVKSAFSLRRLWAIFEPRSASSRRKVFQKDYLHAFLGADEVLLCEVEARTTDSKQDLLSVHELSDGIRKQGGLAQAFPDARAIKTHLLSNLKDGDVILVMSNGSFGGLPGDLEKECRAKW